MKFCVMKAAQRDAVANFQRVHWKERGRQNMMRLQLRFACANTTRAVAGNHFFDPFFSVSNVAKRFLRLPVDEVGVALSFVSLADDATLTATPFASAGTRGAKAVAVLARFEPCATNTARLRLHHRPKQRLVDPKQRAFKTPYRARVSAQILCGL